MEIKYTIEILTKDIQDIEKLVGNLQNSQDGSAIELDLALSKLRNVYEILTMIKADRLNELIHPEMKPAPGPVPDPVPDPVPAPVPETSFKTEPAPEVAKDAEILAEKFSSESSINENMAGQRGKDKDSKLMGQSIENIGRNIGINDRFLIIRELFDGDSDGFARLLAKLDGANGYQDAIGLLKEEFANSMEHEGIEILTGLVKRRYIRD